MVFVLIRRCVKADKEHEFLASYGKGRPKHGDFIDETLTRMNASADLPESMRLGAWRRRSSYVTYLNVARWRSAKSFEERFKPRTMHDPKFECSDRLRGVLDEVDP